MKICKTELRSHKLNERSWYPSLPLGVIALVALGLSIAPGQLVSSSAQEVQSKPVVLTAEQDHKRLMDLLHVAALRPGANPRSSDAASQPNYDEAKSNPYPNLPDVLQLKNGKRVTSAKVWWNQRRPEIMEDFDREIYGRVP